MKKLLSLITLCLLLVSSSYALVLKSDANGKVIVSEPQLLVSQMAPRVTLVTPDFNHMTIGGDTGKVQIISTIESFNTSVCDQQTMLLNKAAKNELKDVSIYVVTTNQPFIVNAYQTKHKIDNIHLLSAFDNPAFGKAYGVQVIGGELKGITARSIFVINKKGEIVYKQITPNIDHMIDMKAAIAAAKRAEKS